MIVEYEFVCDIEEVSGRYGRLFGSSEEIVIVEEK
jgi:hypothetical protein